MILTLILLISSTLWGANAHSDLSVGIQGRTGPSIGAEANLDTGYNLVFWGQKNEKKDVLYGLIRPSLGLSTSGVINAVKGELEFFPISFIGLTVGRQIIHSNYKFSFLKCDEIVCKGEFHRNYVEGKMALGAQGWIAVGHYKVDVVQATNGKLPMADWRNVIVGQNGRDVQIEKKLILGKFVGDHMFGVLLENVKFQDSGEMRESYTGAYQFKHNSTNYMMAIGVYKTSQVPLGGIIYFRINNSLFPSSKLF